MSNAVVEVGVRDRVDVTPAGAQRRLVREVREVRAREARGRRRDVLEVDVLRQRLALGVDVEDRAPGGGLRQIDDDAPVEPPRPQQRRVEHVRTVGRGHHDREVFALEAVQLREQLVERLLALVVATAEPGAARAADRVDLVDEHDRRRVLLGLLEQLADAGRADTDEHLDELRRGDRIERHAGLAGDRPREQGLAGARRTDEQHAARDLRTELAKPIRLLEELDDLLEIALGRGEPGDVLEGHARARRLLELAAALQKAAERPAAGDHHRLRAARQPHPHADDQDPRQQRDQDLEHHRLLRLDDADRDAVVLEHRHQPIVLGHERVEREDELPVDDLGHHERAGEAGVLDHHLLDVAVTDPAEHRRVVDLGARGLLVRRAPQPEHGEENREDEPSPWPTAWNAGWSGSRSGIHAAIQRKSRTGASARRPRTSCGSDPAAVRTRTHCAMPYHRGFMIGTTVGGYRITGHLAQGGMGAVWEAKHAVMDRSAVVKLLHPELGHDAEIVQRFVNEARAAASINDPGIVQVFDVGHLDDGRAYIVMERLGGHTLAERLRQRAAEPPSRARAVETVNVLRLIVRTLVAAHAHGIVHRDLKPENIFLVPDPDVVGGERTKIVDFGIAKLATGTGSNSTRAGSIFGTPAYMAPEQCADAGSVDARADLYAIGCIAYEMLVGQPPFGVGGVEVIAAHLRDEPKPLRERDPAVPPSLEAIVAQLLRKAPADRYASSAELLAVLDALELDAAALLTPRPFDVPSTVPPTVPPTVSPTKPARPLAARSSPEPASRAQPTPPQQPPQPALTTHSAASGSAVTPPPSPTKRRPYAIAAIAAIAVAAVVAVVVWPRSDATSGGAAAPAVVEQGNPLADAIQAQAEERWADAIAAAERVTRDGDRPRAQAIVAKARAELAHQKAFAEVERAASAGDVAAATGALTAIPQDSVYRARAEQLVRAAEEHARVALAPPAAPAPAPAPAPTTAPKTPAPKTPAPKTPAPRPELKPERPLVRPGPLHPAPEKLPRPELEPVRPTLAPESPPPAPEVTPPAPEVTPPAPEVTPPAPEVTPPAPEPRRPASTPRVRAVNAGPLWNTADAQKKCPALCPPPSKWTGGWRTTIPNKMSTCDCVTP